ncbi:crustacean hyperglycemic hormone 6-like [Oratosquilla oratoria]|uniref:crustacean hyperglycemic hormone 6-like n=1 Tax=Oratosquilla oratoria TaxID=337810 RepID=UPI003F75B55B
MVASQTHGRPLAFILLLGLLLAHQCRGGIIKVRTNTMREFLSLKCGGEFDKGEYAVLTRICDDCYNLARNATVFLGCRANCFRNELFPKCVSFLMQEYRQEELNSKVALVSGESF